MRLALSVILVFFVAIRSFEWWLEYVNLRYVRRQGADIPPEFRGSLDEDLLAKMRLYLAEKTQFSIFTSGLSSIAILVFLLMGLFDWYNTRIASFGLSPVVSAWFFFLSLFLAFEILSIPFSLHFTFNIENKYGFNTMTYRLWVTDFLKSMLLSIVLLSALLFAGFWLIERSPHLWWLFFWCFALAFSLFVTYLSPYVIEPLFNKFTPMEDGMLKERIVTLTRKAGITVSKVLRMDESRRSTHTNAYFTGIGRTKRIVLFDTLLRSMDEDEVLAVLAHEAGHWKKRHLLKTLIVSQALSLALIFASSRLIQGEYLTHLFGLRLDTTYSKVLIVLFLVSMLTFVLKPLFNGFSRMFEREADRFSCDLQDGGGAMIPVLVKLSKDNLSNLFPHPWYARFSYSHPPVLERIRYIREYCGREKSE
jgi:STE24 endopeptidase